MTTVLIVDKNPKNLEEALSVNGYKTIVLNDFTQISKIIEYEKFDIIVMNVIMPSISIWAFLNQFSSSNNTPIIITSSIKDEEPMVKALQNGADDYLIKPYTIQNLIARIEAILRRTKTSTKPNNNKIKDTLTKREIEILQLVSKGDNNKKIADKLFLSEVTIKSHMTHILKKLNVKNRTQAVLLYKHI